jgi:hypothetical protein
VTRFLFSRADDSVDLLWSIFLDCRAGLAGCAVSVDFFGTRRCG